MLHTTFNQLKVAGACGQKRGSGEGYDKLATYLGGSGVYGKDTPIPLDVVVESNGLEDAIWCLRATTEAEAPEEFWVVHEFIRGYLADVLEHLTERVTFSVNTLRFLNATVALLRSPADTDARDDAADTADDAARVVARAERAAETTNYAVRAAVVAANINNYAVRAAHAAAVADDAENEAEAAEAADTTSYAVARAIAYDADFDANVVFDASAFETAFYAEREWQTKRFLAALRI